MAEVTVLMPVFNAEKYLKESIDSILNQTFKNFILLVINDGSTDGSEALILSYKDERIKYVKNDKNLGLIETLNRGLDLIESKYICRMDADDISHLSRLQIQYDFMEQNPEVGVCSTQIKLFGEENAIWKTQLNHKDIKARLLFGSSIAHAASMFRTSVFKINNIKYNPEFPHQEDTILWHNLKNITQFAVIDEVLFFYRREGQNITIENKKSKKKRDYKVFAYILQELIDFSPQELEIHLILSKTNTHLERKINLYKIKNWTRKLIKANSFKEIYPQTELKKAIGEKWDKLAFSILDKNRWKIFSYWFYSGKIKMDELKYFLLSFRRKKA